jgi:hypothetical protein
MCGCGHAMQTGKTTCLTVSTTNEPKPAPVPPAMLCRNKTLLRWSHASAWWQPKESELTSAQPGPARQQTRLSSQELAHAVAVLGAIGVVTPRPVVAGAALASQRAPLVEPPPCAHRRPQRVFHHLARMSRGEQERCGGQVDDRARALGSMSSKTARAVYSAAWEPSRCTRGLKNACDGSPEP